MKIILKNTTERQGCKKYLQYDSIYDFKRKLYVACAYITHFFKSIKDKMQ